MTHRPTALICGVTGQDGAYLASLLLEKGYNVVGTSRDAQASSLQNLRTLEIDGQIGLRSLAPGDFRNVLEVISEVQPAEIYYLAGQSSVGLSFEQPAETLMSITFGTLNMLEALRISKCEARFYHASSSECFGDVGSVAADESFPFRPRSPYGVAKSAAHALVVNYREQHRIFASNGILFNHESPLRPARFVTRKIVDGALRIRAGSAVSLQLGRLDVVRDWGWAPEYVEAMWRILQADSPDDFVIATGESHSLQDFVAAAFKAVGLDWTEHVVFSNEFSRRTEITCSRANPMKAAERLDWRAGVRMADVVERMINGTSGSKAHR